MIYLLLAFLSGVAGLNEARVDTSEGPVVIEDFESYEDGGLPLRWRGLEGRRLVPLTGRREPGEFYAVQQEGGRRFLRMRIQNESARIVLPNREAFSWDLEEHPRLRWDWRALQLPQGAREDNVNDSGAALYITFSVDLLGRPKSIKYTYSSTLPVGTVVSYGRLKVVVVATGAEGLGEWMQVERDVRADYSRLFGSDPPENPVSIALWSDSDTTGGVAEVDFDNLTILPPR